MVDELKCIIIVAFNSNGFSQSFQLQKLFPRTNWFLFNYRKNKLYFEKLQFPYFAFKSLSKTNNGCYSTLNQKQVKPETKKQFSQNRL